MAGWDYYIYDLPESPDPKDLLFKLDALGAKSWELVAVDKGMMFFKRYQSYEDGLRPDVAAEGGGKSLLGWVADSEVGQKKLEAISSTNSGLDGVSHSHRVIVIVDKNMEVLKGTTDEVDGHIHPITMVGVLDEVEGHTHTFSVE